MNTVIYEDESILAVNKAPGIAVTADRWDPGRERLDRLLARERLFVVHRIDRDTSGVVVFAKNEGAHRALSAAFERRRVEKRYLAVVHGRPAWEGGQAASDLPLVPDGDKQHRTIIDRYQGKPSKTRFRLLGGAGFLYSLVEARPETGRTHQIRVHLASLGHPVVCDSLYGKDAKTPKPVFLSSFKKNWRGDRFEEKPLLARLGLHAESLLLPPECCPGAAAGEKGLLLQAPLPRDLSALTHQFAKWGFVIEGNGE